MNSDEDIADELRRASDGLLMMSESDYPFDVVQWKQADAVTPEALRHIAGAQIDAPVTTQDLDDFFRAAMTEHVGQSAAARSSARNFRQLAQTLNASLQAVRVYKVGAVNMRVYILGQTASGHWLGLATRIVET